MPVKDIRFILIFTDDSPLRNTGAEGIKIKDAQN